MKRYEKVSGQMDLFDLIANMQTMSANAGMIAADLNLMDEVGTEKENYLLRGEKIISLLRARKPQKEFKESSFLDLFSTKAWENATNRVEYVLRRIKQKMIRPIIEGCVTWDNDVEQRFRSLFCGYDAGISFDSVSDYERNVYSAVVNAQQSDCWCVSLRRGDSHAVMGNKRLSYRKSGGKWRMRRVRGDSVQLFDFGEFFSEMVFVCQIKHYLKEYFADRSKTDLANDVVYRRMKELADAEMETLIQRGKSNDGKLYVFPNALENPFLNKVMGDLGIKLEAQAKYSTLQVTFEDVMVTFLLSDVPETEYGMPLNGRYSRHAISAYGNIITAVLSIILDDYSEEKQAQAYRRALSETYAKSFMTKKNIPEKMVHAMEASGFNHIFGYVEFDEECDIAKIDDLYLEFDALAKFLHLSKHEEVSLRFRKLGQHKAGGLYYPTVKCMCVDVRQPSSFSHEMFHMLDYENGDVSRAWDFQTIKDLYKTEFERLQKEQHITLQGKYDKSYYFQSTEIFARCGEMYLTQICGIDNSLVKPNLGSVVYPWTEELAEAVKAYYDAFLGLETENYDFAAQGGEHCEKEAS